MKHSITQAQLDFEADVLQALFAGFEEEKVRYAVLRNFEQVPFSVGARDIDIIVHSSDLPSACLVVRKVTDTKQLRYGNFYADERLTQFALVGRDKTGDLLQIKIDLFTRSEVYGIEIFSAAEILQDVRKHNEIEVVSDNVLVLDKWVFHLLVGQPLDAKYDAGFADTARSNGPALIKGLTRFLNVNRATALVAQLADGKGSKLTLSKTERLLALARLWAAQGPIALPRSLRFFGFRLRDWLRPQGIFLSISGPDGSGKTTVIDLVLDELRAIYGEGAVHNSHFRPTVLPRIAEVAKKARAVENVDIDYSRPHRAKPSGRTGSLGRLGYYWLDYLIGYHRRVGPILRRRQVMLYDRYYYDMISDPFRSRISLSMSLLRFMGRLLPLPQFAFFIQVDSDEVYRRKKELSLKRIIELNSRYSDLAHRGWMIQVDNNGTPKQAAAAIIDHIVAHRHLRAERRSH